MLHLLPRLNGRLLSRPYAACQDAAHLIRSIPRGQNGEQSSAKGTTDCEPDLSANA